MKHEEEWTRLAQLLRRQRVVVLGFPTRAAFVRHLGLSHDRVINDLENARRDTYGIDTLLSIEGWYGLSADQLRDVLGGMYPAHDIATRHDVGTIQSTRSHKDQTLEDLQDSIAAISAALDHMRAQLEQLESESK